MVVRVSLLLHSQNQRNRDIIDIVIVIVIWKVD
jgi:hypothetical protein